MDVLEAWERLRKMRELTFVARSHSAIATGWNGVGKGTVLVDLLDPVTMVFHERGAWTPDGGQEINFRNVFRWTLDSEGRSIRLEHLRFGADNPVYLFDLVPVCAEALEATEPHVCREDLYAARMEYDQDVIRLSWTITGPRKNESIAYVYS